jgi:hypothetical protein
VLTLEVTTTHNAHALQAAENSKNNWLATNSDLNSKVAVQRSLETKQHIDMAPLFVLFRSIFYVGTFCFFV